ncbi:hypothetical protein [Acrocarpospora phusangensis]|uniref:hypothetical protein n=1 Tax=Acrocarpospora phusangensis TaxID=1070424 RepID=UPI0019525EE4|nr:hypothetical protein [Acrocarpospora phusangensis]
MEIVVRNPSPYERTGVIFAELPESRPHLVTADGSWVPVQWLEHGPSLVDGRVVEPSVTVAAWVTVPAAGRIVLVASAAPALNPRPGGGGSLPGPGVLDNGLLRVAALDGVITLRAAGGAEAGGPGLPDPAEVDDVLRGTLVSAMEIAGAEAVLRVELRAGEPFARLEALAGELPAGWEPVPGRLAVLRDPASAARLAVLPWRAGEPALARLAAEYRHGLLAGPGEERRGALSQ